MLIAIIIAVACIIAAALLLTAEPTTRLRALLPPPNGKREVTQDSAVPVRASLLQRHHKKDQPGPSAADLLAFDLDLVAICLQAGLTTERALDLAAEAGGDRSGLARLGRSLALGEAEGEEELRTVASLIEFSRSTGVSLAPLLRGLATDLRRSEHRRRQLAAAKLGVQLVVPLGACILPAFVLLGVVPVMLTLVTDMAGIFG